VTIRLDAEGEHVRVLERALVLVVVLLTAVLVTGCGDSGETTLTFTGSECVQSGPDAIVAGEFVTFTLENESSVDVAVIVLELGNVTLEELVADDALFFPTDSWPVTGGIPEEVYSAWLVGSSSDDERSVVFTRTGDYGTVCWPIDGSPAIQGALLTVEE
jgi:hypothetical protein